MSAEDDVLAIVANLKGKIAGIKTGVEKILAEHEQPDGSIDAAGVDRIKKAILDDSADADAITAELPADAPVVTDPPPAEQQ